MKHLLFTVILICIIHFSISIIGGNYVRIKDYPYQVSLHYLGQHICGGVIIDSSTVLTAAHCVYGTHDIGFTIRVGSSLHDEGKEYIVSNILQHPNYNLHENDIAILKLNQDIIFSKNISPLLYLQDNDIDSGTNCKISGWGRTREEIISTHLKALEVYIIQNEDCDVYFKSKVTSKMICAQSYECPQLSFINLFNQVVKGDSGGPLVCEINGRLKLVGLVSFGNNCEKRDCPTVYTKISSFYEWIYLNRHNNGNRNTFITKL